MGDGGFALSGNGTECVAAIKIMVSANAHVRIQVNSKEVIAVLEG
jgi:hypothetical protein